MVQTYGGWGQEAVTTFAWLSKVLDLYCRQPSTILLNELYSVELMRQNAQALLADALPGHGLCIKIEYLYWHNVAYVYKTI